MYSEYFVNDGYAVSMYFSDQYNEFVMSERNVSISSENDRFKSATNLHYTLIDYSLLAGAESSSTVYLIIAKSAVFAACIVAFATPILFDLYFSKHRRRLQSAAAAAAAASSDKPAKPTNPMDGTGLQQTTFAHSVLRHPTDLSFHQRVRSRINSAHPQSYRISFDQASPSTQARYFSYDDDQYYDEL